MIICPKRSNCFIWALCHWIKRGGYVSWRASHHVKFIPHFLWSPDLTVWYSYVPIKPLPWWRFDFIIFQGHVVENYHSGTSIKDE